MSDVEKDLALVEQTWGGRDPDGTSAVDRIRTHIDELEAENKRYKWGLRKLAWMYLEYRYSAGTIDDDPEWAREMVDMWVEEALGTQSTTDSDLPEGAVECPMCLGTKQVFDGRTPGCNCPTCHGTGHVCEVCVGAVGEPKHRHPGQFNDWQYHPEGEANHSGHVPHTTLESCTADYHKEEK